MTLTGKMTVACGGSDYLRDARLRFTRHPSSGVEASQVHLPSAKNPYLKVGCQFVELMPVYGIQ